MLGNLPLLLTLESDRYVCLSVCFSVCWPVCLSACFWFVCLYGCKYVCMCVCISVGLFNVCVVACLFVCMFVPLIFVCPSADKPSWQNEYICLWPSKFDCWSPYSYSQDEVERARIRVFIKNHTITN